jgi:flagellar basal-body rod modification protein FlgD
MAVSGINSPVNNLNAFSAMTGAGKNSAKQQQIDFMAMLMVQLKHQNPMQPYDNQQFAAQLATFSQLEQLTDIKNLLGDQADVIGMMAMSMENTALPAIIGKYASASSRTLDFDGINPSEIGFKTNMEASSGKAMIYNSSGHLVKTINLEAHQCKVGEHTIE